MLGLESELSSLRVENQDLRTLLRFMTVGVANTLLDFGFFTLLHAAIGISTLPSNIISYSIGIINGFVFSRYWTFTGRPKKSAQLQFVQFALVSLSALVINTGVVQFLTPQFSGMIHNDVTGALLAKVCATAIGLCWNFIANSLWTFRKGQAVEQDLH